ncbi:MAG: cytochrome c, partial [Pseudomonadota bacterium]
MKILKTVFVVFVLLLLGLGSWFALTDKPLKKIETLALQHADTLRLGVLGEKLFDQHCAGCHDNPQMHAPSREALSGFSLDTVAVAMKFGKMQPMASHLSDIEQGLIAIYLSGSESADFD